MNTWFYSVANKLEKMLKIKLGDILQLFHYVSNMALNEPWP